MKKLLSLLITIGLLSTMIGIADFSKPISVNAAVDLAYADKLAGSTADVLLPHGSQPIFASKDFKYSLVVEIKKEYSVIPGSVYVLGEQSIYEVKDFSELTNLAFVNEKYTWSDWEISKNADEYFRLKLILDFNPGTDLEQQIALLEQREDVRQVNYYSENKKPTIYPGLSIVTNSLFVELKKEFSDPENIRTLDFFPEISELVNVESLRYYPDWEIDPGENVFNREGYRELLKLTFSEDYDAANAISKIESLEEVREVIYNYYRSDGTRSGLDQKQPHTDYPTGATLINPNKLHVVLLKWYSDPDIKKDSDYFSDIPNLVEIKNSTIINFSQRRSDTFGLYRFNEFLQFTFSEGTDLQQMVELLEAREDVRLVVYDILYPEPTPADDTPTSTTTAEPPTTSTDVTKIGDINLNSKIGELSDVILLGKYLSNKADFTEEQKINADCHSDVGLTSNDLNALIKLSFAEIDVADLPL